MISTQVDLRMAVCGACVVVCSAVDGPDDIDEKLLEPLERAWRRPVTAPVEDSGAARAAERLLRAMRSYDAAAARKRASQDAEFVETCVEIKFRTPQAIDARLPPFLCLFDGVHCLIPT